MTAGGRRSALAAAAFLVAGCATERDEPPREPSGGFPPGFAARVDSIARAARANGPLAGLSIAVARAGEPVFVGTWGVADAASGAEVDRSTLYEIASVTKLYTGITAAMLADEGALELDAPLSSLLPELSGVPHASRIRVHHLLTHTSGLEDFEPAVIDAWLEDRDPAGAEAALEAARREPAFAPGTSWAYSNTGFRLVGEAIARLEGEPFATVLRERVTTPLGLEDTRLCDERPDDPRRARIHEVAEGGFELSRFDRMPGFTSEGGLCATIEDLVRLPAALAIRGVLPEPAIDRVLSPTALSTGLSIDYGLGVRLGGVEGHTAWGHTGGMGTYWAVLIHFPEEGVTVAVLQNTEGAAEDALTVAGPVVRAALGLGRPTLEPRDIGDLSRFAGRYDDEGGGFDIALVGDSLVRIRGARHALIPLGPREFGWRLFPMDRFRFHEIDGRVVGVSEYYNGLFGSWFPRLRALDPVPAPPGPATATPGDGVQATRDS